MEKEFDKVIPGSDKITSDKSSSAIGKSLDFTTSSTIQSIEIPILPILEHSSPKPPTQSYNHRSASPNRVRRLQDTHIGPELESPERIKQQTDQDETYLNTPRIRPRRKSSLMRAGTQTHLLAPTLLIQAQKIVIPREVVQDVKDEVQQNRLQEAASAEITQVRSRALSMMGSIGGEEESSQGNDVRLKGVAGASMKAISRKIDAFTSFLHSNSKTTYHLNSAVDIRRLHLKILSTVLVWINFSMSKDIELKQLFNHQIEPKERKLKQRNSISNAECYGRRNLARTEILNRPNMRLLASFLPAVRIKRRTFALWTVWLKYTNKLKTKQVKRDPAVRKYVGTSLGNRMQSWYRIACYPELDWNPLVPNSRVTRQQVLTSLEREMKEIPMQSRLEVYRNAWIPLQKMSKYYLNSLGDDHILYQKCQERITRVREALGFDPDELGARSYSDISFR